MIPVLYAENTTDFTNNGLGLLKESTSCICDEKRNDYYECTLKYPIDGELYDQIKAKMWIKAKANDRYGEQPFRIYKISTPINGFVTIYAEHISYELRDNFIASCSFSGNCAGALNALNSAAAYTSGFTFSSDISSSQNYSVSALPFWSAIVGAKGSIIDTYGNGADIIRDNKNITVKADGGYSNNVLIAYKKNLKNFTCTEDWSKVCTGIYPFAKKTDGTIVTLTEKYIYSPLYSTDARDIHPRIYSKDYTMDFDSDDDVTEENLRAKCQNYFTDTDVDKPSLTYKIELVPLLKTEEYKDSGISEKIGLFDTVIIRHEKYNLDTTVKIVREKYDTLRERIEVLDLGTMKQSILDTIKNALKTDEENELSGLVTKGFLDDAIEELTDAITGSDGGYVRLVPKDNPSQILVLDNEDLNQAVTVWRWNKDGWGVSQNGYNGPFVGLTANGKLVINSATANVITAALIQGGTLQSLSGNTYINLENGQFNLADMFTYDGTTFTFNLGAVGGATTSDVEDAEDNAVATARGDYQNAKVNISVDGVTVYNGSITIKNNLGASVISADDDGNMVISANCTIKGRLQPNDYILHMLSSSDSTNCSTLPSGTNVPIECVIDGGQGDLRLKRDWFQYIQLNKDGTFRFFTHKSAIADESAYLNFATDDFLRIECYRTTGENSQIVRHAFIGNSTVGIKFLDNTGASTESHVAQIRYGLDGGYADLHLQDLKALGNINTAGNISVAGDLSYGSLTANSSETYKTNIDDINSETCTSIVKNNDVKKYNLKSEIAQRIESMGLSNSLAEEDVEYSGADPLVNKRVGLIVEDLTDEAKTYLVPDGKDGIDLYSMVSILWKTVQAQQNKIEELENRLSILEGGNTDE